MNADAVPRGAHDDGSGDQTERHPHSGPGPSSQPRRAGTGERQAPARHCATDDPTADAALIPGEVLYGDELIEINAGKDVITIRVDNTADRPVQVGSHYHFAEVNPSLSFDRDAAWGRRLNVLSGGSVRFEPGVAVDVELIPIGGQRVVAGLRGQSAGPLDG